MSDYSVILHKFLESLIPFFLRNTKLMSYVKVCVSQLQYVADLFTSYANDKKYEVQHTGQVISLEHLLNDEFDSTERRIYIADAVQFVNPMLRFESEAIDSFELRFESEAVTTDAVRFEVEFYSQYDFIVYKHSSTTDVDKLRNTVNKYRQAGKKFDVVNI